MGILKIGSSSNKAGVTIDPRTVLFNDNNVKYIKSGLVEIWSNLKPLVPIMTSNTTPYGEVMGSTNSSMSRFGEDSYLPFSISAPSEATACYTNGDYAQITYNFTAFTCCKKFGFSSNTDNQTSYPSKITVEASNDNSTWNKLFEQAPSETVGNKITIYELNNDKHYLYYRVSINKGQLNYINISYLQFYGTQIVGLVPILKQDDGKVLYNGYFAQYFPYEAFDGTNNDQGDSWLFQGNGTNVAYIGYNFGIEKKVNKIYIQNRGEAEAPRAIKSFMLQGSNDLETWYDIEEFNVISNEIRAGQFFDVSDPKKYKAFRVFVTQVYDTAYVGLGILQFFN